MSIITSLPQREVEAITDHLGTTAGAMVKCYTIRQLSALDGVDTRTVKNSGRYIPVRIDGKDARRSYLNRKAYKRPYQIKRIRVDEIKTVYNNRNKFRKLEEEFK